MRKNLPEHKEVALQRPGVTVSVCLGCHVSGRCSVLVCVVRLGGRGRGISVLRVVASAYMLCVCVCVCVCVLGLGRI